MSTPQRPASSVQPPGTSEAPATSDPHRPGLALHITSFSYKRGYPVDATGHGGGFVFDCRALHNPGRYAEYKSLSGLDASVIRFLEGVSELEDFWENVRTIVTASVAAYQARGFSDLSVAFGCTGGQHRSVYLAERLARYMREQYPDIVVDLLHREEGTGWSRAVEEIGRNMGERGEG